MTADCIIDDHIELANIGTNTHAQIDAHIANSAIHHVKYTNAEAVAAVASADSYVKNIGDTITSNLVFSTINTGITTLNGGYFKERLANRIDIGWGGSNGGNMECYSKNYVGREGQYRFVYGGGDYGEVQFYHYNGITYRLVLSYTKDLELDMKNHIIKDMKNYVHSALSGTKKLVEIKIGSTPYFFEVYPTKA